MVEVKSPTDSLKKLRQKVQSFLSLGTQIGIVVNPEAHTVEVYRSEEDTPQVLSDGDQLMLPELLPGWNLAIADLWPLVF